MATQEEIIQQYQEDRNRKLLQLQNTLSSRVAQSAKENAAIIDDVSIISTISVADDFMEKERILSYQNGKDSKFPVDLRNKFVTKNSTPSEPFVYLSIFPTVLSLSEDSVNVTISQVLFFRNAGGTDENIENVRSSPKKIEIDSFGDLNKEFSSYSFPFEINFITGRYKKYLDVANDKLKSIGVNTTLESFPILVYSQILIPDGTQTSQFSKVFPKPEGYVVGPSIPSVPNAPSVPDVPTVPDSTITGTIPTSIPSTPNVPSVPTGVTEKPDKYLSIEAVKDDDPVIETSSTGSNVISLRFIDDNEVNDYYSSSELNTIKTKTAESKQNQPPVNPIGDKNPIVVKNEKKNVETKTAAQKRGEDSDSIVKEKPKQKSSTSPSKGNPKLSDGKEADRDEKTESGNKKEPPPITKNEKPLAKTFLEWHKSEGRDPSGIIYRGNTDKKYTGSPDNVNITDGLVESRYKNLFDFGSNLKKLFGDLEFNSPIDVALALNGIQVGLFNKQIPYTFVEGSEVQSAIIPRTAIVREESGGLGTVNNNANWGNEPYWCGYFTNFVLFNNGRYESDKSLSDIAATNYVYRDGGYYDKSPFNVIIETEQTEIKRITKDTVELKRSLSKDGWNSKLEEKKKKEESTRKSLQKYIDNTPTTEVNDPKLKQLQTNYNQAKGELDAVQKTVDDINSKIKANEAALNQKQSNINSTFDPNNNVALFQYGYHISLDGSLTTRGRDLWERIKDWKGAYIVKREEKGGHVEVLLHFSKSGKIYTLGGNTGITLTGKDLTSKDIDELKRRANPSAEKPGTVDRNGYQYGFKITSSPGSWAGNGNDLYVVKRGTSKPYTKGIGIGLLKTTLWREYEKLISAGTDSTVSPMAYNLIKGIFVG